MYRYAASLALAFCLALSGVAEEKLELKKGNHICYIGNTLADRMQHHGWLETFIQQRFPEMNLVVRNLGFSADEITVRPRSSNFGDEHQHLSRCKADVIFAFFGYNESFAGKEGLDTFKKNLAKMIDDYRGKNYNGKAPPRMVIFSPIAHENLNNPHLPDGKENNKRLALYTEAMREVAKAKKAVFVDLFAPTKALYSKVQKPLTINGIHLTEEGNRQVGEVIDEALFGGKPTRTEAQLQEIRKAVLDKNLHWFNRYRTTDGYSIFGGRAKAGGGPDGLDNRAVMAREMEILDVMTANRDKRIWSLANGKDMKVDDSNAPQPLKPVTNRPGKEKGGTYPFLSGEAAIQKMKVAKGMKATLFASEEQFPELINPVQMSFDTDGRLWVAAWPTYPHWNPNKEMNDKLLILPDEDGDGKADRCIVFADKLHNPTGFEFWNGGVLVAQAPDIMFLKDTDGDDKADVRIRILHGIDSADTHHTANSFILGPAGHLYFQRGVFHYTNVEQPHGKPFRSDSTGMYRLDLRTGEIAKHFNMGPNPHGNAFDRWGYQFATDGTTGNGFYIGYPGKGAPGTLYRKRVRPVPGIGILSSEHFPKANQGNLLICNVIGFQGIAQYRFVDEGAGFRAEEIEPILSSSDRNFRPTSAEVGGDGALYVIDWQNPLIGHLQHNLRDPNRDHLHGRVYRITANDRPLKKPVKMKGKSIVEVLSHLTSPTAGVRYRARIELTSRDSKDVASATAQWAKQFDPKNKDHAQPLVEALWIHQQHRVVNVDLLKKVLSSVEPNARAAATRVLRDWADQIKDAGTLLIQTAKDKHPRVRAEAVVAAATYSGTNSAEVIFEVEQWPLDTQLSYVLSQARGSINISKYLDEMKASGKKLSPAAQAYVLRNASLNDLLKLERNEAVYQAILLRDNIPEKVISEALKSLAASQKVDEVTVLLNFLEELDSKEKTANLPNLSKILASQSTAKLKGSKERVRKLALNGKAVETRRAGYLAWMIADGSPDAAFKQAVESKARLRELLGAVPKLPSEEIRSKLYAHLSPLMQKLPKHLQENAGSATDYNQGIRVDYFEPHPREKNVAIETLAKMKPTATGVVPEIKMNVPQLRRRDAFALRFTGMIQIDRGGTYTFAVASDDGSRIYIGGDLVVNNDGLHGMRERRGRIKLSSGAHPIVVTYFDNGGGDGLRVRWTGPGIRGLQPIPSKKLSVSGFETVKDVIIRTLKAIPGHEAEKFTYLAELLKNGNNRISAVRAMKSIASKFWSKKEIRPVAESLAKQVSEIPAKYRTSRSAIEAMELVDALAELLPKEEAEKFQSQLAELKVRVIRIGTVPHRMIYDKDRVVVEAGKTVEFILTNTDDMPHNFAIVQPGSMEEIGKLAEDTAQAPDAMARHFIPKSAKVLLSSELLNKGDTQALSFEVPKKPGIYPYVCTYPGHWRRMYGALYVVGDVKDYASNPEAYLKEHELEIKDPLLKYSTKGREWALEDLLSGVKPLPMGRSFEVGQNIFKMATCISCHRMSTEGQQFGPELTKLEAKKQAPEYLLRAILEPSHEIDKKYLTYTFEMASGKTLFGMVIKEGPKEVTVLTDPLAKQPPVVLKKKDIEERILSKKSMMPEGLVNRFSREEILDLIAFIYAKGNKKHPMFHHHKK